MDRKTTCEELEQRVKELKKELRDKDKQIQSILESADGFAIYRLIVDKEDPYLLRPIFVSPSIRKVLGCEPDNFSSQTFFSNIHPDDLARVEQANKQAFETNRFDEICRYYNLIKKQWTWIHAISTGVVNDEGHISHVNGIFIDITEQKKAEESFRRSEEHLRCIMESATNFAVYQLISDETNPHRLKVNFVSPSIQDILGIPEPMEFETWFENMHPDDVERISAANQRAFKTFRFDEEYRTYNRKKGEWRWIHAISTGGTDKKEWNRHVNGILLDITDRKHTEEAFRESEERFRKLAEGSFESIVIHNKGVILDANDQYYETFGYNPEELAGKDAISLTATPESIENIREQIYSGALGPYEVTGVKKDGTKFPMEVRIKLTSQNGNRVRMAVIRDLTDRKEMEKKLQDANQKWMSLIENTNDFIMIINDKGEIQYINRAIAPHTISQVIGKTLYDFSVPEHHEIIRQAVARVFETRKQESYTSSVKHPTGIQWFQTTMIPIIEEDKVRSVMSFNKIITESKQAEEALRKAYDELEIRVKERTAELVSTNAKLKKEIDERKKSEEALQESEEKYRSLFQGAANPITILDKEGIIIMINDAGARQLGLPQHECAGKPVGEIIPNLDDSYYEVYREVIDTGREVTKEAFVELPSGSRWFWSIHQPVVNISGIRYGIQVISYDITERKKAEEALKTSLREKEVLLREIHHRVKNNFEIISSLLYLSSMQTKNREIHKICKNVHGRLHSMALIHDQLYQNDRFDRVDMGKHSQSLADYIADVYSVTKKDITTIVEPSEVYLSLNQAIPCSLALNELITNAHKHAFKTRTKGTIHVFITQSTDDSVLLRVKDDGDGLPEEIGISNTERVGIKLVRHLIKGQLKGEMHIDLDNGTEFQIEFKKDKL